MGFRETIKRGIKYILHGVPEQVCMKTSAQIVVLGPNQMLSGRNALVVGGTRGIGYAMASAFLDAGAANVIITGRHPETNAEACRKLLEKEGNAGRVHSMVLDYAKTDELAQVPQRCEELLHGGRLDILVNNGGVMGKHILSTDEENWDAVMNANLRGVYFLSRAVGMYMKERQIQGNILNVASSSCAYPAPAPYYVSKWGIRAITPGLAKVFVPYGIVVNCLVPGPTATDMLHKTGEDITAPGLPFGRYTMPEEMAGVALMLVGPMGRSIVGDCVFATGGCGVVTVDDNNHAGAYRV